MDIQIIRGTTNTINITLKNADGTARTLTSGEKLIFGVKRNVEDETYLIKKILTSSNYLGGKYVVAIDPSDTQNLIIGVHVYDVGLQSGTSYFNVIPCSHFEILKNVTVKEVQ